MMKSPRILLLGVVIGLALRPPACEAQVAPAPAGAAEVPPQAAPEVVSGLAERLSDRMRLLAEEVDGELGRTPSGPNLVQDARELSQAADDFRASLTAGADPFQTRRRFAGVDASWQHLRAQLGQPANTAPAVDRAARRVDDVEAQVRQAVGLNALPGDYYTAATAPTGTAQLQRLAHALVARAEALEAAVREQMGRQPEGAALAQNAARLAREADAFHDAINVNQRPAQVARAFGPVARIADGLESDLARLAPPPPVTAAWKNFASAELLLRQGLELPTPPPDIAGAQPAEGPSPVVGLADRLVGEVSAFLQVFSQTAGVVPEGGFFLGDAQRLQAAAVDFRADVARGLDPSQLAFEFRDVDAAWQRLARRTERIARGRTGPNIQQVQRMGGTIAEIHQLLGVPGYAPAVGVAAPPLPAGPGNPPAPIGP